MKELIEKIQESLKTNDSLSNEEKEAYFVKLELLKDMPDENGHITKALTALSEKPEGVKEFFTGMEEAMSAYLKGGAQGLMDKLDEVK
jgi:hypothetical protein